MLDDDSTRYYIRLNLPFGCVRVNRYPAINDRVICYAEDIQPVHHWQHRYTGYAAICRVAIEAEIEAVCKGLAENADPKRTRRAKSMNAVFQGSYSVPLLCWVAFYRRDSKKMRLA